MSESMDKTNEGILSYSEQRRGDDNTPIARLLYSNG